MRKGRGGHVFHDDELGKLAGAVIAQVQPNRSDRETREECWQTAYVAGLMAQVSAHRSQQQTSRHMLMLAMRSAVYRALHRARKELREADLLHA